ncbi:MAG: ABC transporter permease, partial [Burkholderiales bacterium]|nr:ABC transporter permease [Anaerolineae bacterium]
MSPVILKLARRYISRRLLQSVLFMIGVALGVAVVVAIDLANTSSSRAFSLSTESITGKATHQILAGPSGLSTDVYRTVRLELGLRDSAPIVEEYVRSSEESLGGQPLHILGVDPFAEPPFRDYLTTVNLIGEPDPSGSSAFDALNAFIAEPNTALISGTLAERYGVSVGDTITLRPQNNTVEARVVGILQAVDETSAAAIDDLVLTDIATAQELLGRPGQLSRIDLILPEGYDL